MMTARIIPFPLARRRDLVARQAHRIAELSGQGRDRRADERHLQHQLEIQRVALRRKGIDDTVIEAEVRALEAAIRTRLWFDILQPGDSA